MKTKKEGQLLSESQPTKTNKAISAFFYSRNNTRKSDNALPTVGQYCRSKGWQLKHFTEWKKTNCPFCAANKTLLIRPDCGAFKCMMCGARGKDLISLHMQLHRIPFYLACEQLSQMVEVFE